MASDKAHGILGKCDLDLSKFGDGEFNMMTLSLRNCQYEGAYVEVGVKGVPNPKAASPSANPLNRSTTSLSASAQSQPEMQISEANYIQAV